VSWGLNVVSEKAYFCSCGDLWLVLKERLSSVVLDMLFYRQHDTGLLCIFTQNILAASVGGPNRLKLFFGGTLFHS